uniref:Uncharacterized protein n=1 Tax=Cacopsylla melanoneura TaxID=428564 RepID=A0A8D8V4Q3_9HEMI
MYDGRNSILRVLFFVQNERENSQTEESYTRGTDKTEDIKKIKRFKFFFLFSFLSQNLKKKEGNIQGGGGSFKLKHRGINRVFRRSIHITRKAAGLKTIHYPKLMLLPKSDSPRLFNVFTNSKCFSQVQVKVKKVTSENERRVRQIPNSVSSKAAGS